MESTGTYGDVLRHQLEGQDLVVHQVSCRRVHDSKVVYDGVASLHDAKCAAIIAKLRLVENDGYGLLMVDTDLGMRASVGDG